jgi:hypothetical protein
MAAGEGDGLPGCGQVSRARWIAGQVSRCRPGGGEDAASSGMAAHVVPLNQRSVRPLARLPGRKFW